MPPFPKRFKAGSGWLFSSDLDFFHPSPTGAQVEPGERTHRAIVRGLERMGVGPGAAKLCEGAPYLVSQTIRPFAYDTGGDVDSIMEHLGLLERARAATTTIAGAATAMAAGNFISKANLLLAGGSCIVPATDFNILDPRFPKLFKKRTATSAEDRPEKHTVRRADPLRVRKIGALERSRLQEEKDEADAAASAAGSFHSLSTIG